MMVVTRMIHDDDNGGDLLWCCCGNLGRRCSPGPVQTSLGCPLAAEHRQELQVPVWKLEIHHFFPEWFWKGLRLKSIHMKCQDSRKLSNSKGVGSLPPEWGSLSEIKENPEIELLWLKPDSLNQQPSQMKIEIVIYLATIHKDDDDVLKGMSFCCACHFIPRLEDFCWKLTHGEPTAS